MWQHPSSRLFACIQLFVYACGSIWALPSYANDLPPPPRSAADLNQAYKLYVDLSINGYATGQVIPVIVKGEDFFIPLQVFADLHITLPAERTSTTELSRNQIITLGFANQPEDWLQLKSHPDIQFHYVAAQQTLALQLPAKWMPLQMLGRDTWYNQQAAQSSFGFLNNYNFLANRDSQGNLNGNLLLEQRLFAKFGVLKNTGIYSIDRHRSEFDQTAPSQQGYTRYESNWQYDIQRSATSIVIGDVISASKNTWGSAVRLGGIQIKRDFGTRPDLITYPLPQFIGQTALPSTVDLLINGQKTYSNSVQSGPFLINNVPFISGRGEAIIVTTDSVGRQVSSSIPFYVASNLLKKHLLDYSFSSGKLRRNFGIDQANYGDWVTAFDGRYGMQDWWTLEAKAEYADAVQVLGLGSVFRVQQYGTINAAFSRSNAPDPEDASNRLGQQISLGYSFNQPGFGISISHIQRNRYFSDLSHLELSNLVSVNSQKISTVQSYYSLPKYGTLGLSYIDSQSHELRSQLLNASISPRLPDELRGFSLSISVSHDIVARQWAAALQLMLPLFNNRSSLNAGYSKDFGSNYGYLNYSKTAPSQGGFGIDIGRRFNDTGPNINQAELSYFNSLVNLDLGINHSGDRQNYWLGASGSLVLMKQGLFISNRLGDSFALIDTHGVADIPVKYENSLIGQSNRKGYIFVPSVSPYYMAKYSIDPLGLPSSYNASKTEQRMAAKRGAAIVVDFPIKHSNSAMVYFVDSAQQVLPVGAMVHRQHASSSYIGMDGMAYLEDLQQHNQVSIQLPNQKLCQASFTVDMAQAEQQIASIKGVICHEVQP